MTAPLTAAASLSNRPRFTSSARSERSQKPFGNDGCFTSFLHMITEDSAQKVTTEDRLRGAVWGQFVGDAAALGVHWIYDLSELSARFPGGVFGFEAPAAGDYHESKTPGDLTHYGDGALLLLESIAEHGSFDPRA